jgi:excisionase family DNA binding protein
MQPNTFTTVPNSVFSSGHMASNIEMAVAASALDVRLSPWWTVDEAATYLRCARVTVYRAIKSGRLRARKFGREWRTRREWIDQGALVDAAR